MCVPWQDGDPRKEKHSHIFVRYPGLKGLALQQRVFEEFSDGKSYKLVFYEPASGEGLI